MATGITAGKILRRGVESLGNDAMVYLLKNKDQVQRINDDFDSRRTALIEQHTATQAEIAKLEEKEADLVTRETTLADAREAIETAAATALEENAAAMDALKRRTSEVMARETATQERVVALDARENEIEAQGRVRENELQGREEVLEGDEAAAETRAQELQAQASGLDARHTSLETAAKMVKRAVAPLG